MRVNRINFARKLSFLNVSGDEGTRRCGQSLSRLTWWRFHRKHLEMFHPVWQSIGFLLSSAELFIKNNSLGVSLSGSQIARLFLPTRVQAPVKTCNKNLYCKFYDCQYLSENVEREQKTLLLYLYLDCLFIFLLYLPFEATKKLGKVRPAIGNLFSNFCQPE